MLGMPAHRNSIHDGIRAHYDSVFGKERIEEVHWTPGPMAGRLPDFHIAKVRPETPDGMWVFASIGAWAATSDEPTSLEFLAVARSEAAAVMQQLAFAAYYHAGAPEHRLGVGHTVPIGQGWVSGSPLDHILVSLPYLWGPELEHCPVSGRHVQVVWLLPIYEVERDFKVRHGSRRWSSGSRWHGSTTSIHSGRRSLPPGKTEDGS